MKKTALLTMGAIALEIMSASSAAAQSSQCNWTGDWNTSRGELNLSQNGKTITGNQRNLARLQL